MTSDKWVSGLELFRSGRYFETHEEWEEAWREAPAEERDFYQGMVHLTVALYQAGRGNARGARAQLRKAHRRLSRYFPAHRGISLDRLVPEVVAGVEQVLAGADIATVRLPVLNSTAP